MEKLIMFNFISLGLIFYSTLVFANKSQKHISFLAFGDNGYHYDYLKKKVINKPMSTEDFISARKKKWIKSYLALEDFKPPPIHIIKNTNKAIEASGAQPVANAIFNFCASNKCQFALMLGDNLYPHGATGEDDKIRFKKIFEIPYKKIIKKNKNFKFYAALGNHDWGSSREGRNIQIKYGERESSAFTMKKPGYYKFKKGNIEFFVLDTNLLLSGSLVRKDALNPDGSEKPLEELENPEEWEIPNNQDKKQLKWLKISLKNSKTKWKIIYGHHPLWSSGGEKFEEARSLRKLILPLVCRYSDLYISGHEHNLELNQDSCQKVLGTEKYPLTLITSGAGSWQRPIHRAFQSLQKLKYPQYKSIWSKGMTWGFSYLKVFDDHVIIKMISTPSNESGVPVIEKTFRFKNRSLITKNLKINLNLEIFKANWIQ